MQLQRVFAFSICGLILIVGKATLVLTEDYSNCTCDAGGIYALDDKIQDFIKAVSAVADADNGDSNGKTHPGEPGDQKVLSNVRKATDEIFQHVIRTHVEHYRDPEWHFADEKIQEGHQLLLRLRRQLMSILSATDQPDYRACRQIIGEIFHLIWSFYTNTNWIEMFPTKMYNNLGQPNKPLFPLAPSTFPTCGKCRSTDKQAPCIQKLLVDNFLTSGYFAAERKHRGKTNEKPPDDKCLHGTQLYWRSSKTKGTQDMLTDSSTCPYFTCQRQEDTKHITIQHVLYYLTDTVSGLLKGDQNITLNILLGIEPISEVLYIDSLDLTEKNEFEKSLENSSTDISKAANLQLACQSGINAMTVLRISQSVMNDTLPESCTYNDVDVHLLHVMSHTRAPRYRRSYDNLDIYHLIASASGGTVYETTKGNIGEVVDIIKDSIISSAPVSVMKFNWTARANNSVEIPVDDQILNLTIKVQSSKLTSIYLDKPDGTREFFMDKKVSLRKFLGSNLVIIKLFSPSPGVWRLERGSANQCDVDVTGISRLDFSYQLMQPGPDGFGEYPLVGRPIAGVNTSVMVSIALVDTVMSVERLLLLTGEGEVSATAKLHNVGGRRGKTRFRTAIVMPVKEFKVAVEGQDKSGHTYRREDPKLVSSLAIKLEVFPISGPLYVKGSVTIPFTVTNVGGGSTKTEVDIIDSLNLAQSPTKVVKTLASGKSASGTFRLNAGSSKKGQTTTVTISAKTVGAAQNKVQFHVQRITIEEKIAKAIDSIKPTCNVTSTTGTCYVGVDVCACVNYTWSMTVEFGDEGFGLQTVFASDAGNQSTLTNDTFALGHLQKNGVKHASLRADCCHQGAKINVVDMAGNVGICDVTINPKFTAPDPKLCNRKPPSVSGSKTSLLSCSTTSVSGTCDFRNETCGDPCLDEKVCGKYQWTYTAHIGNESVGAIQAVPLKVDARTNLNVHTRDISLTTTCCHTSVVIKVIDLAGKVGQCSGSIKVKTIKTEEVYDPPESSPESSPEAGVIVGVAVGGATLVGVVIAVVILIKKQIICANEIKPSNNDNSSNISF